MPPTVTCPVCGTPRTAYGVKYCSHACAMKARMAAPCRLCGKPRRPADQRTRSKSRTCDACRNSYAKEYQRRNREQILRRGRMYYRENHEHVRHLHNLNARKNRRKRNVHIGTRGDCPTCGRGFVRGIHQHRKLYCSAYCRRIEERCKQTYPGAYSDPVMRPIVIGIIRASAAVFGSVERWGEGR